MARVPAPGEFITSNGEAYVIAPDGGVATVSVDELPLAISEGATPATQEQSLAMKVKRRVKEEQGDRPVATFMESALSGASLGFSDVIAEKTGLTTDVERDARRELNPKSNISGQIAGGIGGAFIPGVGPLKALGMVPSGMAARLALRGAEKLVKNPGVARVATAGAIDGALTGAVTRLNDRIARDFDQERAAYGEGLASDIGLDVAKSTALGAALGAALGGSLEIAGRGIGTVARKVQEGRRSLSEGYPRQLERSLGNLDPADAAKVQDLSDDLTRIMKDESLEKFIPKSEISKVKSEVVEYIVKTAGDYKALMEALKSPAFGYMKPGVKQSLVNDFKSMAELTSKFGTSKRDVARAIDRMKPDEINDFIQGLFQGQYNKFVQIDEVAYEAIQAGINLNKRGDVSKFLSRWQSTELPNSISRLNDVVSDISSRFRLDETLGKYRVPQDSATDAFSLLSGFAASHAIDSVLPIGLAGAYVGSKRAMRAYNNFIKDPERVIETAVKAKRMADKFEQRMDKLSEFVLSKRMAQESPNAYAARLQAVSGSVIPLRDAEDSPEKKKADSRKADITRMKHAGSSLDENGRVRTIEDTMGMDKSRRDRVRQQARNPEGLMENLAQLTESISEYDPELAQSIQMTQANRIAYLSELSDQNISDRRFNQIYEVVENPFRLAGRIESGQVTSQEIAAVDETAPALANKMRMSIMRRMNQMSPQDIEAIPRSRRQAIRMFLDGAKPIIPGDFQAGYEPVKSRKSPSKAKPVPPAIELTPAQRLEQR